MTPEELAAIRERNEDWNVMSEIPTAVADRRALLAHIDALEKAVEGLPEWEDVAYIDRAAVLALIRGTPR